MKDPIKGPIVGPIVCESVIIDVLLALVSMGNISAHTAGAIVIDAAPVRPARKRIMVSPAMFGAKAQPSRKAQLIHVATTMTG